MPNKLGIHARKPANNKGADQPAHSRSLISALFVRFFGKYHIYTCYERYLIFLASLCSCGDWFESRFVGNPEDRFCRIEAQLISALKAASRHNWKQRRQSLGNILSTLPLRLSSSPVLEFCLILKTPIATKVVCFSRLLKCLRNLFGKQCGPRSDCSYRSSLFWVHAVCFYT